jgi:putative hydroxymethylpyrimidine transport system substrate-binding protein
MRGGEASKKVRGSAPGPRWGLRPQTPFCAVATPPIELEDSGRAALTTAAARRRGLGQSPSLLTRRRFGLLAAAAVVPAEPDHLTILLDWFINPDHAPLLVAQQTGAFARAGLAVELVAPADTAMAPKLVAAGHGDIALTDEPHFHEQIAGGLPLRRVGALIDRPLSTLATLRRTGIAKLGDLRGRRIGHGSGDAERAMVGAMLATVGLSLNDVHMVNIGEQLTVALLTGQVDAVTVYRNFEILELREQGAEPIAFDYETNGVPWFDEMILVTRERLASDPRLPRLMNAIRHAVATLRADPLAAWRSCAATEADLNTSLNKAAWMASVPFFATDPAAVNLGRYDAFAAFLAKAGIIPPPRPASTYVTEVGDG